ncbi:hypothetical protein JVU11DRAFT_9790 [Chiua virens]|nr:hypothetical protein JVU11DRAFT_9790 [Chiua virens]
MISDEAGFEDVEVDQRALVNILTRYPGEFGVLRELIQNADDAEANKVEVHFQTGDSEKSQPIDWFDLSRVGVCKWIVINDGIAFTDGDWGRLRKIADGNKNATKVGAFGVGFYSVFSKTDKPLVKSSDKSLQFVRGEDGRLRNQFVNCSAISGTSIELELRTKEALPKLDNLARFLVSSVTFLTHIESAEVYLDDIRLLHIHKEPCKPPVEVPIPQHLVRMTSSEALTVESMQRTAQTIKIDAAECMFPSDQLMPSVLDATDILVERRRRRAEDHIPRTSHSVDTVLEENAITHDLYTATTHVNLLPDSEMRRGVRSVMKTLPSTFECRAVYFNPEQSDAFDRIKNSHSRNTKYLASLFSGPQGIVPENDGGRLFIGQSTNQTTGIALHISAHFLPTMERSSIDLANGQVAAWNHEVLNVGGLLARVVYEQEMHRAAKSKNEFGTKLGLSTMARFAFGSTVPHSGVSQILRDAFYSCHNSSKSPFPVVTAGGIGYASDPQFRQSNKDLSFLKKYRVLHEEIKDHQRSRIIMQYDIPHFRYGDIVREFETGVTREALRSFFSWWEDIRRNSLATDEARNAAEKFCTMFASRAILHTSHDSRMELKNIKYYTFFPLPDDLSRPDTIYIDVSSGVPTQGTVEAFGWSQLSLLDWLEYAHTQARQHTSNSVSGPDSDLGFRISLALVQFALVETLSEEQWDRIAAFMKDLKCIPTNKGLKTPGESFLEMADICESLPIASESEFLSIPMTSVASKSSAFEYRSVTLEHVRNVLTHTGVCEMMRWDKLVARLKNVASEETNDRLLYLLSVICRRSAPSPLPSQCLVDLRVQKIFYSKSHGRVSATDLYFPDRDLHKLKLPILALPQGRASLHNLVHSSGSFPIERFIEQLGVRRYPPLEKVISLAASGDPGVQRSARRYLLSNLDTHYSAYKPEDFSDYAFIPTQTGSLARLNEVFASQGWEKLGFKLVSKDLGRNYLRLGIRDGPSADMIIEHLKVPRTTLPDLETATTWFEHLCDHGNIPIAKLRDQLSTIPFVPVQNSSASSSEPSLIEYTSPKDCFVGLTEAKEHHRDIFSFVYFGRNGNDFLERCGAKKSPDASDIARKMRQDPKRYMKALRNNYDLYLEDLLTIAFRLDLVPDDEKQAMKKLRCFLLSGLTRRGCYQ